MSTKLTRISQLSAEREEVVFRQLMHHFDKDSLRDCFSKLGTKSASGSDGITKAQYGEQLDDNLDSLVERLKRMAYRPSAVKEVMIPKEGRREAYRPLGISNVEDKIVQKRFQEILEAIYEPLFHESSYGFRPNRGCHDAIKALREHLYHHDTKTVIDLDLSNYFGSIDHELLMSLLEQKISEKTVSALHPSDVEMWDTE